MFPSKVTWHNACDEILSRVLRVKALQKKMPNMLEEGMMISYQKLTREH